MLRKVRRRTVKWTTEGAAKREFVEKGMYCLIQDSLSILRREACVKCQGYNGIMFMYTVSFKERLLQAKQGGTAGKSILVLDRIIYSVRDFFSLAEADSKVCAVLPVGTGISAESDRQCIKKVKRKGVCMCRAWRAKQRNGKGVKYDDKPDIGGM